MVEEKGKPLTREDVEREIINHGGPEGLNLSRATFVEAIDLSGLDLHGIILKETKFPTSFKREILEGADLRGTHLEKADLTKAHLERAELHETHLEGANLRDAHLEGAILWDTHLEGANLMVTHLEGANLMRTKFSHNVSLEDVEWGNKYTLDEEKPGFFDSAVASYRHLKMWYTEHGMYDIAGKFFYREMEAKRKAQSWKKEPASKLWSWVIRLLCGYGERYGNVVVAALVIIFGLVVVYVYGGLNPSYAIYFSAVSFTSLGYGNWVDITPYGWVQALGAVESFLGAFIIALFLVTFTRKLTR